MSQSQGVPDSGGVGVGQATSTGPIARPADQSVQADYALRLGPDQQVTDLSADPPAGGTSLGDKAKLAREGLLERLDGLQDRLYAEGRRKLLVVMQAMDTGGKDGTIRKVFSRTNIMGLRVARFQAPTATDLARDYLWRVHAEVPARGEIGVFNRSHYEDVLTVRVNELVPEAVWRRRYGHLRDFERMLADEGTRIVKLYLHIDRDEQRKRLQERLDDPDKRWKFEPNDVIQRRRWDDYMKAYGDAIHETDCDHAPWYVIPANAKWYRDLAVLDVLVKTLEAMDPQYPMPRFSPADTKVDP